MLHRLVFPLKNLANTPKHFEYDQIKIKIFGLKDEATKPFKKRKRSKNHKLPSFRRSLKFKDTFACEIFTQRFPLFFQPIFNFQQRMLIFRNKPGSIEISFLPSPSLKYLDFYDVSENSEHINTFRGAPT